MNHLPLAFGLAQQDSGAAVGTFTTLLWLAFALFMVAAQWKVFSKAGQPGWAAIIPIYNAVVLLRIVGRPLWWLVLLLIPLVNFVVGIILTIDLAKSYGKGVGFALGLLFLSPIFLPILGFGSARYTGPAAAQTTPHPAMA